jgi:hypothetical protein
MKLQLFFILFLLSVVIHSGYSEIDDSIQSVARQDIAELMMKKYPLQVDQHDFIIYYRFSTLESVGEGTSEDLEAQITSIEVDHERNSLVIRLDNIAQSDLMSVRFPQELMSAEKGKFTLLIDGKERGYEWSVQEDSRNLIFVIPERTTEVEIIGTRVIPEFASWLPVLVIVSSGLLVIQRFYKKSV